MRTLAPTNCNAIRLGAAWSCAHTSHTHTPHVLAAHVCDPQTKPKNASALQAPRAPRAQSAGAEPAAERRTSIRRRGRRVYNTARLYPAEPMDGLPAKWREEKKRDSETLLFGRRGRPRRSGTLVGRKEEEGVPCAWRRKGEQRSSAIPLSLSLSHQSNLGNWYDLPHTDMARPLKVSLTSLSNLALSEARSSAASLLRGSSAFGSSMRNWRPMITL